MSDTDTKKEETQQEPLGNVPGFAELSLESLRPYYEQNKDKIPAEYGGDVDKFLKGIKSLKDTQAFATRKAQEAAELRKRLEALESSGTPQEGSEGNPEGSEEIDSDSPLQIEVEEEKPAPKGKLKLDDLVKEFVEKGTVSDESYKRLSETLDMPKEAVEAFIKNAVRESRQRAAEWIGGEDNLNKVLKWAKESLPRERQIQINKDLQGASAEYVLKGLYAEMVAKVGKEPTKTPGTVNRNSPQGLQPFKSKGEMFAFMATPQYQNPDDFPQVQEEFRQRFALSKQQGIF